MSNIFNLKGIELASDDEKQVINHYLEEYYNKLIRYLDINSIDFSLKTYKNQGKNKNYSVHIRVKSQNTSFEADYSDWDLAKVIHKVFSKVMNEIEKQLHLSDHNKK